MALLQLIFHMRFDDQWELAGHFMVQRIIAIWITTIYMIEP